MAIEEPSHLLGLTTAGLVVLQMEVLIHGRHHATTGTWLELHATWENRWRLQIFSLTMLAWSLLSCRLAVLSCCLVGEMSLTPVMLIFGHVSLASCSRHAYVLLQKMVHNNCVRGCKRIQDLVVLHCRNWKSIPPLWHIYFLVGYPQGKCPTLSFGIFY